MTLDAKPVADIAVQFDAAHTLVANDLAARLKVELETGLKADRFCSAQSNMGPTSCRTHRCAHRGWYLPASLKAF